MKINKKRAVVTVIILGLVLSIFSGILVTMSYRKMQSDAYVHNEKLHTISAVRKVNYALSFGKPLERYYGLVDLLEETMSLSDHILGIEMTDQEGVRVEVCGEMPDKVRRSGAGEEYVFNPDGIYTFVEFDAGTMVVRLQSDIIHKMTRDFLLFYVKIGAVVFFCLILAAVLSFMILSGDGIGVRRMRITCILLLVLAQGVLGGVSMVYMDTFWGNSVEQIAQSAADIVESDINAVIEKGVSYEEITGIDTYLDNIITDIPEIDSLDLSGKVDKNDKDAVEFELDIKGMEEAPVKLACVCHYDEDLIRKNRRNNIIDSVILLLITIFISLESVNFLTAHLEMKDSRKVGEPYLPGFRLFNFVVSLAFTLDAGFFSVLSRKMFAAMDLPDSMSFMSGMPNTMYSAAVLIGLFGCSSLIRRIGMKRILTLGLIFGILGYVFCALSPNLPLLIASRFIYGLCDGIIINSVRLYASARKDPELHKKLLVEYTAACNLGVSCGVVIGGLVADAASHTAVFLLGAVLGAVCIFLAWFAGFPGKQDQEDGENDMSFFSAVKELKRPQVLVFMVFVVVPLYIATLFVGYTFPLFGDEVGFSNSMVSGFLMINFIIIAYLTDPIADKALKLLPPKYLMVVYMILQTLSIGLFVVTGSVWAAILALVLTSLWDGFGMVAMDLGLDHVEGTTTEKCTLLQMVFGKMGLIAAPVAITSQLARGAAGATGVIILVLIPGLLVYTLFLFTSRNKTGSQVQKKMG